MTPPNNSFFLAKIYCDLFLVANLFGIEGSGQEHHAQMFGSNGAEIINAEMFEALIEKYINSPDAYIRVVFLGISELKNVRISCEVCD